jgi:hypothetical protein
LPCCCIVLPGGDWKPAPDAIAREPEPLVGHRCDLGNDDDPHGLESGGYAQGTNDIVQPGHTARFDRGDAPTRSESTAFGRLIWGE